MAIPRSIKQYLVHNNANYQRKLHNVAYTAQEIAEAEHVPGAEFAKTVVLQADHRIILAMLPADCVVDLEALKRQIPCGKIAISPASDFVERFPGCQPGAVPPLGKLFGLTLYCDSALAKQPEIEFNAGTHTDTIRISFPGFARLENPLMASFSEKPVGKHVARVA